LAEGPATFCLHPALVKPGGDPLLSTPRVRPAREPLHIPAPFRDLAGVGKHCHQSKRIHSAEREFAKRVLGQCSSMCGSNGRDDDTSAGSIVFRALGHRVPVDQREGGTRIVDCDPSSTHWFRRVEHAVAVEVPGGRRARLWAGPFLVAIHPQAIALTARNKGDRTHGSINPPRAGQRRAGQIHATFSKEQRLVLAGYPG